METKPDVSEQQSISEEISFKCWLKKQLGIADAPPQVLFLVVVLCSLIICVLLLVFYAVFKKLDNNTKYLINSESEHISYHTTELLPPDISIKNFQYAMECSEYSKEIYVEGVLNVSPEYVFKLTRIIDDEVNITIVKAPDQNKAENANENPALGYFEVEGEELEFENCLAIRIILSDENPIFQFNAIGDIELGKNITDAQDNYLPLVLSGEITVTGETLFSHSPYQFTPYEIKKSDYIFSKPTVDHQQTAIIRASKGDSGLTGIVALQGGRLYVQRYRMAPQTIESSFIDRVSNDYELAFSLSVALIFIQFTFGIINFLLRIELISD